jgi:hypothetical protein
MYKARHDTDAVVRLSDNMIVGPEHEEEWAEYQAWVSAGNTPDEPDPLPAQPIEPTIQEKLARAGLSIDELKQALGLN